MSALSSRRQDQEQKKSSASDRNNVVRKARRMKQYVRARQVVAVLSTMMDRQKDESLESEPGVWLVYIEKMVFMKDHGQQAQTLSPE